VLRRCTLVAIKGHFDGKVIVPDEPLDLPKHQRLIVHIETVDGASLPPESVARGVDGRQLLRFAGAIPPEDLALMERAIEEGCERIDGDDW
jgi:hypothetical protein